MSKNGGSKRTRGLFDAMLGNASTLDRSKAAEEASFLLTPGESIELAFKLVRDLIVFTNRRLIIVDKQGVSGKKIEYLSVPYKSIVRFSIETAGHFDRDAELRVFMSGNPQPIEKQFRKGDANILEVQRVLALAVLES